jgi:hypothetical protein
MKIVINIPELFYSSPVRRLRRRLATGVRLLLMAGVASLGLTAPATAVTCLPPAETPTVQLTSPNGGQALEPGSTYEISWVGNGSAQVSLLLSLDGGATFEETLAQAQTGYSYVWTVPDIFTEQARIMVQAYDYCGSAAGSDLSEADFLINGTPADPPATTGITLTYPEAGRVVKDSLILEARTAEPVAQVSFWLENASTAARQQLAAVSDLAEMGWSHSFDSRAVPNGPYHLWAQAGGDGFADVSTAPISLTVENVVLPAIKSAITEPLSGSGLQGVIQLGALTDGQADALDFVIRPKALDSAAESAVVYGLTTGIGKAWTATFDTRKYPDGAYYIKAKTYTFGQVVGESAEIEVLFDNPDTDDIGVTLSAPAVNSRLSGTVALVARTAERVRSVDFVVTADAAAGGDQEPIIVKATPDLEKRKWTALWNTLDATNASYGLKAKAYQDGLLAGESALIAVSVYNQPVLVRVDLLAPAHNSQVQGTVRLTARTGEAVEGLNFRLQAIDDSAAAPPLTLAAKVLDDRTGWALDWDSTAELDGRHFLWAEAIYQNRIVGQSARGEIWLENQAAASAYTGDLTVAESLAPETDPNQTDEYVTESALAATPTISLNRSLAVPETPEYLFPPGSLIKTAEAPAVYYYGRDGKRYVFPDSKTYFTWYRNFNRVLTVSAAELAAAPIGGNVTYRPGSRMVKITSDPKVYAVARGGLLRWVKNEVVARRLYGTNWNEQIDDVSDAYFVNYQIGPVIED